MTVDVEQYLRRQLLSQGHAGQILQSAGVFVQFLQGL
jgi:hypothetical protein